MTFETLYTKSKVKMTYVDSYIMHTQVSKDMSKGDIAIVSSKYHIQSGHLVQSEKDAFYHT